MFEAGTRMALRLRHTLAQAPERGAYPLAGRERRIQQQRTLGRLLQRLLQQFGQRLI